MKSRIHQKRYAMIDRKALLDLFSIDNQERFRQEHRHRVEAELQGDVKKRKSLWSESIAIGSEEFIENIQQQLGLRAKGRIIQDDSLVRPRLIR